MFDCQGGEGAGNAVAPVLVFVVSWLGCLGRWRGACATQLPSSESPTADMLPCSFPVLGQKWVFLEKLSCSCLKIRCPHPRAFRFNLAVIEIKFVN